MNNNTNNSEGSIPEEVLELIPWYAIGNLSVDDHALFEEALVSYPSLQKLVETEQQIQQAVSANHSILDRSAIAPTEERLKSVLNMIDVEEARESSKQNNSILDKLKSAIDTLVPRSNGVPQYARVASIGILVVSVAVLTAFVAPLFNDKSDFIPASISEPNVDQTTPTNSINATTLLVGYKGSSVELGENTVLKGKVIKIESVPEKDGMYQISFKESMGKDEIKQMIDSLSSQKDLIWFAGEAY